MSVETEAGILMARDNSSTDLLPAGTGAVDGGSDLRQLLGVIACRVAEVVGEASVLTLLSDDGTVLEPVAFHHDDPEVAALIGDVLSAGPAFVGEGIVGTVAAERRPAIIGRLDPAVLTDLVQDAHRPFAERHPMRSLAIVPMVADGELVGTLGVVRTVSHAPYDDHDLAVVESLADQAARAIAAARRPSPVLDLRDHEVLFGLGIDGALVANADGTVRSANPAACALLARPLSQLAGLDLAELVVGAEPSREATGGLVLFGCSEVTMRRATGVTFPAEVATEVFTTGAGEVRTAVVFRDLSEEVAWRSQLEQQAEQLLAMSERDPLTELLNRRGFRGAAEQALAIAAREGVPVQVLFFDLDDLKRVNDSKGHPAGDRLLRRFALAVAAQTRASDVAARIGGDEFVLLMFGADSSEVDDVVGRISTAFAGDDESATGGFSVGAAEWRPGSGDGLDVLVERADRRMYEQKVRRRFGGAGAARGAPDPRSSVGG